VSGWPVSAADLIEAQRALAAERPSPWLPPAGPLCVAGCFVCFPRRHTGVGEFGDPAWAAAAVVRRRRVLGGHVVRGVAGGSYQPGLMALREGRLLEEAVLGLASEPDVLLVNATGRDHPRRAGLAVQLGAVLGIPTVGVTHRPLVAGGPWPEDERGAASPLTLDGEVVGWWLRTRAGRRPLVVHAGWRVDAATAVDIVRRCGGTHRTPAPLREARRLARQARASRS
jgi:deoxyribonuclease V